MLELFEQLGELDLPFETQTNAPPSVRRPPCIIRQPAVRFFFLFVRTAAKSAVEISRCCPLRLAPVG
jgi:hypothetical protein|tara:strand:+ start:1750 stop:1950 length:201 start_codon:yes stop_codon:yes gene_type:complete